MSVVIETTLGDLTVDLYLKERPRSCVNFIKLCKMKYYNYNLFHTISRGFIAQTGDPTGSRKGGTSVYGTIEGPSKRYFEGEKNPRIKHTHLGLVSFVGDTEGMIGSQFFVTLGNDLTYLDDKHCVFGEIVEGLDVIELINETICDDDNRPYKDVRITHTVVLDDPFPDVKGMRVPSRSPSPSAERLKGGRIGADEDIDDTEGKTAAEISEMLAEREAKARATILEMVGDLPDAEMAPPENVLFVCKLNPVTTDDDLEIIFSRFGKIKSCEVIRDRKTGDSLQYSFVEFEDKKSCEDAYFKMDNVLIDDRRIHVDFSQSVSKIKWHGKGRGVTTYDDKGQKAKDVKNDIGQGRYKRTQIVDKKDIGNERNQRRSRSPRNRDNDKRESSRNNDRKRSYERPSDSRRNDTHHYRDDRKYERNRREFNRRNDTDNHRRYDFDRNDQRRFEGERKDSANRRGYEESRTYSQNKREFYENDNRHSKPSSKNRYGSDDNESQDRSNKMKSNVSELDSKTYKDKKYHKESSNNEKKMKKSKQKKDKKVDSSDDEAESEKKRKKKSKKKYSSSSDESDHDEKKKKSKKESNEAKDKKKKKYKDSSNSSSDDEVLRKKSKGNKSKKKHRRSSSSD